MYINDTQLEDMFSRTATDPEALFHIIAPYILYLITMASFSVENRKLEPLISMSWRAGRSKTESGLTLHKT